MEVLTLGVLGCSGNERLGSHRFIVSLPKEGMKSTAMLSSRSFWSFDVIVVKHVLPNCV